MTQILPMRRDDNVALDTGALVRLEDALGTVRSREILAQACCEIIERMTQVELRLEEGNRAEAGRLARGVAALSSEIGLCELSVAARAVVSCLSADDPVALAATMHRLSRVGQISLDALLTNTAARDL